VSGVMVVCEHRAGKVAPASFETASFGKELAGAMGSEAFAVVLGKGALPVAEGYAEATGLRTLYGEHDELAHYNAQGYISALFPIMRERSPAFVLVPHTSTGWDFAPGLSVEAGAGCTTGVAGLRKSGRGVVFQRQICGGKMVTDVAHGEGVAIITVMPGACKPKEAEEAGEVEEIEVRAELRGTRTLGVTESERGGLDLTKAEVIVAAGRGASSEEALSLVRELCGCFDKGAVGASRPVVDAGLLPLEHQVGQTGQMVAPRLYIACGISGAIQHTTGMSGSETVVAINTDPGAGIFSVADLGVVADAMEFLPAFIAELKKRRG